MQYHFDHCSSFTGATQQERCLFFIKLLDKDPTAMAWSSTFKASNRPALTDIHLLKKAFLEMDPSYKLNVLAAVKEWNFPPPFSTATATSVAELVSSWLQAKLLSCPLT